MAQPRLGDLLVSSGVISQDQLGQALARQKETKKRLGEELTVVLPQRIGCCTLRKMTRPQLLQLLREGL